MTSEPRTTSGARTADFPSFFRSEYPRIVREIDLMLGDGDAARDLAQDAFTKLYVHWPKVSRYERPGAWVRRVAIRMGVRWRRNRILPISMIDHAVEAAAEPSTALVMDVRDAVRQLPRMQSAAVVLHYYRDYPVRDVADALGCKEPTAKVHLHRARQKLAELLADYRP